MAKIKRKDIPLAETPNPGDRKPYMSRKEYRAEMRQAKREHNIQAAREGTLSKERGEKTQRAVNIVKDVADAASMLVKPRINVNVGKRNTRETN